MPSSRIENRVSDLLADAREARDAGDWKTARSLLDAVSALDPGNAEAAAMLAGAATRRQMTLLFCDIVGSTELADQRDPEEITAVLRALPPACAEVVDELDGYIDDHRGDGMLVLFGYPQVRRGRRPARRALRSADDRARAGDPLARRRSGARLQVRISVHTDLVVVADGITGSTANEAARLQAARRAGHGGDQRHHPGSGVAWFDDESLGASARCGACRGRWRCSPSARGPARLRRGRTWRDRTSPFVDRSAELSAMEWLAADAGRGGRARRPEPRPEPVGAAGACS